MACTVEGSSGTGVTIRRTKTKPLEFEVTTSSSGGGIGHSIPLQQPGPGVAGPTVHYRFRADGTCYPTDAPARSPFGRLE